MEIKNNHQTVAIIVDGNQSIGMGHVMRCSAIAEALIDMGENVVFISSDKQSKEKIKELGYKTECIGIYYKELFSKQKEVIDCLKQINARFAFVDSYYASNKFFESISSICPVGCFGYGKNYYYGMQLIIPYGISSDRKWYKEEVDHKKTQVLFGSKYIPLKKHYWNISLRDGSAKPQRILLTTGGTDPMGITVELIKQIRKLNTNIFLDIVIGQFYNKSELKNECKKYNKTAFHENLTDLSDLMRSSDLAISAGGITLYELMASSVPTIAYAFADNQLGNCLLDGAIEWCGDIRNNGKLDNEIIKTIVSKVDQLINNTDRRMSLIKQGRNICDGLGALRIAQEIIKIQKNTDNVNNVIQSVGGI